MSLEGANVLNVKHFNLWIFAQVLYLFFRIISFKNRIYISQLMAVYKIYEYSIYLRAQGLFIVRSKEVILD